MAIKVHGEGRFRSLNLTIDREADIGLQVLVARASDYSWKQLEALFGKRRSTLDEHAAKARARLKEKA